MNDNIVEMASLTLNRLETKVGYSERHRITTIQAALAARVLMRENWTIDFNPTSQENRNKHGLKTIWEYAAHRHVWNPLMGGFLADPTDRDRFASLDQNARILRQGFAQLGRMFLADWRHPLFCVPRTKKGKALTAVITIYPEYMVNGDETAAEILKARTRGAPRGRLKLWADRYEAIVGERVSFISDVQKALAEFEDDTLPVGKMEQQLATRREDGAATPVP